MVCRVQGDFPKTSLQHQPLEPPSLGEAVSPHGSPAHMYVDGARRFPRGFFPEGSCPVGSFLEGQFPRRKFPLRTVSLKDSFP